MNIQWYPGHMTKAKRMIQEDIKLIDVVVELIDARAPFSSKNPDIDSLARQKSRVILLNKYDLADEKTTILWKQWMEEKGFLVGLINAKNGTGVKAVQGLLTTACKEKIERDRKKGMINRPIRAMVVGIPNVGKSTFINSFAGKACTKTGNRPGVTKGKQWIRLNKNVELLDTPGILWPKFEDPLVGEHLAFIGSMKEEILNVSDLCLEFLSFLLSQYPGKLQEKYGILEEQLDQVIEESEEDHLEYFSMAQNTQVQEAEKKNMRKRKEAAILKQIAIKRGCKLTGNRPDYEKAAGILIDDFRAGKLGRITLELPPLEES